MISRICSRCGKIVPVGQRCTCQPAYRRDYNRFRRDKRIQQFRASDEWKRVRQQVIERDEGLDQYVLHETGELKAGFSVHHIVPLSDDWSRRTDPSNLITLSDDTHASIEYKYKGKQRAALQSLLFSIVQEREQQHGNE